MKGERSTRRHSERKEADRKWIWEARKRHPSPKEKNLHFVCVCQPLAFSFFLDFRLNPGLGSISDCLYMSFSECQGKRVCDCMFVYVLKEKGKLTKIHTSKKIKMTDIIAS